MERPIHEGLLMQHLAIKKPPALQATIYQNRASGMHPKPRQIFSLFIRKSTHGKLDLFLKRYNSTPFDQLAWISSNDYFTMGFWIYVVRVLSKLRMTRFHEIIDIQALSPRLQKNLNFLYDSPLQRLHECWQCSCMTSGWDWPYPLSFHTGQLPSLSMHESSTAKQGKI